MFNVTVTYAALLFVLLSLHIHIMCVEHVVTIQNGDLYAQCYSHSVIMFFINSHCYQVSLIYEFAQQNFKSFYS